VKDEQEYPFPEDIDDLEQSGRPWVTAIGSILGASIAVIYVLMPVIIFASYTLGWFGFESTTTLLLTTIGVYCVLE
jgi:hypothetical protein